jgi:hypothetical protein
MSKEKVEQTPVSKKINVGESIITGSVAGAVEVAVDHPLWTIKTRLQSRQPFTLQPRVLYRGIVPNAASMVPITATQVGMNGFFKQRMEKKKNKATASKDASDTCPVGNELAQHGATEEMVIENHNIPTPVQDFSNAFKAGAASAVIGSPTELGMTHQGKEAKGFLSTLQSLSGKYGYRTVMVGLPSCAIRDGIFSAFFQAVTPAVKDKMKPYVSNDYALSLGAGITAGVGATVFSHAFDTIKTHQQTADLSKRNSMWQAGRSIMRASGPIGFFKGIIPRGARVVSAVTIMSYTTEKMTDYFQNQNKKSEPNSEQNSDVPTP